MLNVAISNLNGCKIFPIDFILVHLHLYFSPIPRSWWGVLNTTLCDKVCQWLAVGSFFSKGTLDSSTNKTDRHDITKILLKITFIPPKNIPGLIHSWGL